MLLALLFDCGQIVVFGLPDAVSRKQKLRFDERPQELFQRHAVILEKAGDGDGSRADDTKPAHRFTVKHIPQREVKRHGNAHGQQRTNELPQRQAEKERLLIIADFFVDFDFHEIPPEKDAPTPSAS